jgi:hypothetical protein
MKKVPGDPQFLLELQDRKKLIYWDDHTLKYQTLQYNCEKQNERKGKKTRKSYVFVYHTEDLTFKGKWVITKEKM